MAAGVKSVPLDKGSQGYLFHALTCGADHPEECPYFNETLWGWNSRYQWERKAKKWLDTLSDRKRGRHEARGRRKGKP